MKYKLCWKIHQIKNKFPIRPIDHLNTRNTVKISLKTLKGPAVRIGRGKHVQSSTIMMDTSHYSILKHLFALYDLSYSQNIQPPSQLSISFNYNPKQSYTNFNKLIHFVFYDYPPLLANEVCLTLLDILFTTLKWRVIKHSCTHLCSWM